MALTLDEVRHMEMFDVVYSSLMSSETADLFNLVGGHMKWRPI